MTPSGGDLRDVRKTPKTNPLHFRKNRGGGGGFGHPASPSRSCLGAVSCGVSHQRPSSNPACNGLVRSIAPASLDCSCSGQSHSKYRNQRPSTSPAHGSPVRSIANSGQPPERSRTCHSPTSPSMKYHGSGEKSVSAAVPPGLPGSLRVVSASCPTSKVSQRPAVFARGGIDKRPT